MSLLRPVLGLVLAALIAGGCGGGNSHHGSSADDPEPSRTIDVTMSDIHFEPTSVAVKPGETVKFVFHNEGDIVHDAFIGDEAAQTAHEKEMRHGKGGHHEDDDHAVTVDPGQTAELTYTFDKPGTLLIGCHQAGHYSAGMKITVTVAA
jgi:uncharacterized cupredoxin-like copper-binding protein